MGARRRSVKTMSKVKEASSEKDRVKLASMEYASDQYSKYFIGSSIADNSDKLPAFDKDQLKLGKALGKGCFGTVYEVRGVESVSRSNTDQCQFIADHCLREETGDARYAIKALNPEIVKDNGMFIRGTLDMAIETRVLSDTEHPNIIKARALAIVSPFNEEYFIMMDRLYDTLGSRLKKWAKKANRLSGLGNVLDRKGEKKKELWEARLVAAYDLSDALGYLHRKNIIYRDLKPENIGFDIRDDIKLFDFGLAGEMKNSKRAENGLYNLTEMTGSPRYMSPEVANGESYNEKCDVYSFAILFWEILSLKTPFEVYTMSALKSRVWNGEQKRPFIDKAWPEPVKLMLTTSWNSLINARPTFQEITETLRKQCVVARGGNEEGLNHTRRRSTFVFAKMNFLEQMNISQEIYAQ